jgi:hypothetical protein
VTQRISYFIKISFTSKLLFCTALYVGHLSPRLCQRRLRLHTLVILIAVSKRTEFCYKGADRFVAETLLYLLQTQI